ncbi:hypothetical protein DM01DRAFT_324328 [Hesseltinella vesiculosa]|uniref:Uncharacterized protein n=1 Tax=Hesseltinella vesiculosa TaxID=101127 RepID=A0A1X2G722_9FUNG|nr:hypothetical protein DM01DRAFT_324328 [Hesseltinella vesiculosa]
MANAATSFFSSLYQDGPVDVEATRNLLDAIPENSRVSTLESHRLTRPSGSDGCRVPECFRARPHPYIGLSTSSTPGLDGLP